ncbi:MAG: DNA repair protein RadA [Ruminococcaceae bacterium]|nr:DNA repair protein RadA [Oscillospiraceae bacterium]MBR3597012.1 DNA repair protein RadA [Clostridia bacterium]
MAQKNRTVFVCANCGYSTPKWAGKCPDCNEWDTFEEQLPQSRQEINSSYAVTPLKLSDIGEYTEHRYDTGISELNRVLGGGLVKGSVVLLSGDPGIGKSTLLLQTTGSLGVSKNILYVSGEESAHQLKIRANRVGVTSNNLTVICDTDAEAVCAYMKKEMPDVVIIDSIQTMGIKEISSLPGSITQVRECSNLFMRYAKTLDIPVIIVGHVNKDGNIAGPKVLEHIVDCVLYFEGEKNLSYRILRAVKNRYGSTNEIGVFEMNDRGLCEVTNPSQALISGKPSNVSGSCIASVIEGSRPILAEVQGLVCQSGFGNPRRMSTGFDYNRMSLLVAVLEKRAGYFMGNCDIYVNIAGGLKIDEPASDLPVALTLISSLKDEVIRDDCISFGEIGLAGEIRSVSFAEMRIKEAIRLGFKKCIISEHNLKEIPEEYKNKIDIVAVNNIRSAYYEAIK